MMNNCGIGRLWVLLCVLALAWTGHPSAASADSFSDARDAYKAAQKLYAAGKFSKAADKYDAAFRLSRSPVLLYNVALCRRREFQANGNFDKLVEASRLFKEYLDKASPAPAERARADENVAEVEALSVNEAKRRFLVAKAASTRGDHLAAIGNYDAAYQLSGNLNALYNLALAERQQFLADQKLARLARAESLIRSYRRLGGDKFTAEQLSSFLAELIAERKEYQRKREAQARSQESVDMKAARAFYAQGNAQAALGSLVRAEKTKDNTRLSLVQVYRLRGQAAVLAGDDDAAIEAFKRYIALEPAAKGAGLAEQTMAAFGIAKEYWSKRSPLKMEHLPPGTVAPKKRVTMPIRISSDPLKMIESRELRYRREGAKDWVSLKMRNETEEVELPANPMPTEGKEYKMHYYITASDAFTNEIDSLGTAKVPLAFLVSKDAIIRPPPIYKRWWFWAGTGSVVAGSVLTYFLLKPDALPGNVVGEL